MVVKRKISLKRYITAGIITFLIFGLGILLGIIFDYERISSLTLKERAQELDYKSLQLQYLYLSDLTGTNESCPIIRAALEESIKELSYSLELAEKYEKETQINTKEYEAISRTYLLDNLRYWLFSQKTKEVCKEDVINVLYFYSKNNCNICENQGTILSYYKSKLQDKILIFPINTDLEDKETFIKLIKIQYNVTVLPTLVINGNKYEGVVSKEELLQIICKESFNKERCLI